MQSEEEDLVRNLSARLSEEIDNLPRDGKDHAFTINIKGNKGHINLGHQTFDIKSAKQPPPEGSNRARGCPQCGFCTWRYSQLCLHCSYDLHHHDDIAADEKERTRKDTVNRQMLTIFGVFTGLAVLSFIIRDYLPDPIKPWALALTAIFGLMAFVIMTTPNAPATNRLRNRPSGPAMDD
ncbi:hypothetical protein [Pseudomonas prosekii]|uniref:hypothetical protein n=1 Tax=Pseudomonas prosekii TaxID=1148509 RepID=UPI00387A9462